MILQVDPLYTSPNVAPLVEAYMSSAIDMMVLPFLATVSAFMLNVPSASIMLTTAPVVGDAGKVIVKLPPLVFAKMLSPATAV